MSWDDERFRDDGGDAPAPRREPRRGILPIEVAILVGMALTCLASLAYLHLMHR